MFKVNDCVFYGTSGICRIDEIKRDKLTGKDEIDYYVLHPLNENSVKIMIPVGNSKVIMRRIATKEEVYKLIDDMPSMETKWIVDDRQRSEEYTAALKTGDLIKWIELIKTIYLKKQELNSVGKRLSKSDETVFKSAEKLLFEEFSSSLQIPTEEVLSFIKDKIPPEIKEIYFTEKADLS